MGLNWLRYALIELTRGKTEAPDRYLPIGDDAFAGVWSNGRSVICWQGENYVPQKTGIRARVHNWLVGL